MPCRYFSCTVDIFYALYIFFSADPAELGVRAVPVRHVDQQRRPLLHSLHPPPAGHRAGQVSPGSNKYYITSVYHTIYCDIMSIWIQNVHVFILNIHIADLIICFNFYTFYSIYCQKEIHEQTYKIYTGWVKKTGISKNMAINTLKSIRKGNNWCVLENSA